MISSGVIPLGSDLSSSPSWARTGREVRAQTRKENKNIQRVWSRGLISSSVMETGLHHHDCSLRFSFPCTLGRCPEQETAVLPVPVSYTHLTLPTSDLV